MKPSFALGPSVLPGIVMACDIAMIWAALAIHTQFVDYIASSNAREYFVGVFFSILFLALGTYARLYKITAIMRPLRHADQFFAAMMTTVALLMSILFALEVMEDFSLGSLVTFAAFAGVTILSARAALAALFGRLARAGVVGSNVVVFGLRPQAERLARRMAETRPFFAVLTGFFASAPADATEEQLTDGVPMLGGFGELLRQAREGRVDDVIVALPWNADRAVVEAIEQLKELPINVYLSSDLVGFELDFEPVTGPFQQMPLFEVVRRPISGWSFVLKRIEDVALSAVLLVLVAPLLALIAVLIRLDTPGPILFRQPRLGFNNEVFAIYKFRSMHHRQAPETVVRQAQRGDPRITRVGRILRATSLDELPQLLNVIEGTMSLVGPRPHALSHNEEYGRRIRGYFARHRVKPGITGWAQVNGLRGETDTDEKMAARVRCDVYYTENWSILFDLKILVLTAFVVLFQRNAY